MTQQVNRHDLFCWSFDGTTLNDIRNVNENPGVQQMVMTAGGNVTPTSRALSHADPKINITTADLATLLGLVSPSTGLKVSSAWEGQYEKRADGGVYSGSGSHVTLNGTNGYLCINAINAEQDNVQGADAEVEFHPLSSDGMSVPVTVNLSQSLAGSPDVPARFALGPVYANGTEIAATKANIQFGKKVGGKRAGGALFLRTVNVEERLPGIEITVIDPTLCDEAKLNYFLGAMSGTGVVVYLLKVNPGAGRVDGATGAHISFSCASGVWVMTGQQASAQGDVMTTFRADLTGVITVSTTATIP